jgi:hypothetical protein
MAKLRHARIIPSDMFSKIFLWTTNTQARHYDDRIRAVNDPFGRDSITGRIPRCRIRQNTDAIYVEKRSVIRSY